VRHFELRQAFAFGVDYLGESAHQASAIARCHGPPAWESLTGTGNRRVGFLDVKRFDRRDDLLGRRVDHLHGYIRSKPRTRAQSVTAALNAASSTRAALASWSTTSSPSAVRASALHSNNRA